MLKSPTGGRIDELDAGPDEPSLFPSTSANTEGSSTERDPAEMSDVPTPITSTTSSESLRDRFVRSSKSPDKDVEMENAVGIAL